MIFLQNIKIMSIDHLKLVYIFCHQMAEDTVKQTKSMCLSESLASNGRLYG